MKSAVVKLGRESVNGFWRSRMELLKELGEISGKTDNSALESATKQYFFHILIRTYFAGGYYLGISRRQSVLYACLRVSHMQET